MMSTGDVNNAKKVSARFMKDCFADSKLKREKRHYSEPPSETLERPRRGNTIDYLQTEESKLHEKRHYITGGHENGFEPMEKRHFCEDDSAQCLPKLMEKRHFDDDDSDHNEEKPREKRHYRVADETTDEPKIPKLHEKRHYSAADHTNDEPKLHEKRHYEAEDEILEESELPRREYVIDYLATEESEHRDKRHFILDDHTFDDSQ